MESLGTADNIYIWARKVMLNVKVSITHKQVLQLEM
jgi:hypothetical protein